MNRPPQLIVGAKLPLRPMHVWAIRVRLQIERRLRDLALFDIALDSKLRGCDVVVLRLPDVAAAGVLRRRPIVIQQKTRPTRPIRNHGANPPFAGGLVEGEKAGRERLAVSKPDDSRRPPLNSPILSAGERLDSADWAGASGLWHPQPETDEGLDALSQDRQSQGLPAAPWAHQAGEHGPLLGSGAGRRPGSFRGA